MVPGMTRDATRTVQTPDGPMELYEVVPDEKATTAVIVIQEAFGVNDYIRDVTGRFAAAGHHTVAPTMFHRAGGGTAPYDDFAQVMPLFRGMSDDAIIADVDATIGHLRDAGFDDRRIGIVGFCFGGRVTFLVATRRALGAAVGFYGGGIVTKRPSPLRPADR
jgi:carboxymethylenebutenolidase